MKTIVVPTDFSKDANAALDMAAVVARKMDANLVLLHANVKASAALPISEYYFIEQEIEEEYMGQVEKKLAQALGDLAKNPKFDGIGITTEVLEGSIAHAINEAADRFSADLIVMGTKGATGMEDFLIGSNTEKVVRIAKVPVLAVPANAKIEPFATIVLPTTLKDDQLAVFLKVKALQDMFGSKVQILYLNNPLMAANDEEIVEHLNRLLRVSGLENTTLFSDTAMDEEKVILQFADENNAQLIAMATHQRKGLSHFLFGSITEDTVNHSHIPVLTVGI